VKSDPSAMQNPFARFALKTKCCKNCEALILEEKGGPQVAVRGPSEASRITSTILVWKCSAEGDSLYSVPCLRIS
jgi:hypothetical protein